MVWYYAQQIVFLTVDASLFAVVVLRLLRSAARPGVCQQRTKKTLGFLSIALACLGLLHLMNLSLSLLGRNIGGQAWSMIISISSVLAILAYSGFGIFLAAAIGQLQKIALPAGTTEPRPTLRFVADDSTGAKSPPRQMDGRHLWKQIRIGFFRVVGFLLLVGAAPLAFAQEIPGVGLMALLTGVGCLWLGFHHNSPLAIKYASLAQDETDLADHRSS